MSFCKTGRQGEKEACYLLGTMLFPTDSQGHRDSPIKCECDVIESGAQERSYVPLRVAKKTGSIASDGSGVVYYKGGHFYDGSFVNGYFHGEGKLVLVINKTKTVRYCGSFKHGDFSGHGVVEWRVEQDGKVLMSRYTGDLYEGRLHGTGQLDYEDGTTYTGTWYMGKRHGHGSMFYDSRKENYYEGAWVSDLQQGCGTMVVSGKGESKFEGTWMQGRQHGYGDLSTVKTCSTWSYNGLWKFGKFSGLGQLVMQETFTGAAANYGFFGNFEDGEFEGHGIYFYSNGTIYQGTWANGKKQGMGAYYYSDGSQTKCMFENDVLLKKDVSGVSTKSVILKVVDEFPLYYLDLDMIKEELCRSGLGDISLERDQMINVFLEFVTTIRRVYKVYADIDLGFPLKLKVKSMCSFQLSLFLFDCFARKLTGVQWTQHSLERIEALSGIGKLSSNSVLQVFFLVLFKTFCNLLMLLTVGFIRNRIFSQPEMPFHTFFRMFLVENILPATSEPRSWIGFKEYYPKTVLIQHGVALLTIFNELNERVKSVQQFLLLLCDSGVLSVSFSPRYYRYILQRPPFKYGVEDLLLELLTFIEFLHILIGASLVLKGLEVSKISRSIMQPTETKQAVKSRSDSTVNHGMVSTKPSSDGVVSLSKKTTRHGGGGKARNGRICLSKLNNGHKINKRKVKKKDSERLVEDSKLRRRTYYEKKHVNSCEITTEHDVSDASYVGKSKHSRSRYVSKQGDAIQLKQLFTCKHSGSNKQLNTVATRRSKIYVTGEIGDMTDLSQYFRLLNKDDIEECVNIFIEERVLVLLHDFLEKSKGKQAI